MLGACSSAGACEAWLANKVMSTGKIATAQMKAAIWRITRLNGPRRYSSSFIKGIPSGWQRRFHQVTNRCVELDAGVSQVFQSRNNIQWLYWKARLPELTVLSAFEPGDGRASLARRIQTISFPFSKPQRLDELAEELVP